MQGDKFNEMLRSRPFREFLVKTTDGDTFKVHHPDFAMVSPTGFDIAIYDADGHFRLVAMDHVVSLEPAKNGSKKLGRR
ncbi:MAG: hypothetical protein ABIP55_00275 [Tepidisphaeraceae bacterium]